MTQPQRETYRFFHRLQVRWAEVDMQQVVFNGHYLLYFDTAMGALCPDGHPNSSTCGHLKFPHPDRDVTVR